MTVPGSLYYVQYKENDNSQCSWITRSEERQTRLFRPRNRGE